jgi:hypothetical protein
MITNTSPSTRYFVIHSEPRPECGTCSTALLIELEPGASLGTGQPHTEEFPTYEEALARAIELGYEPPEASEMPEAPEVPEAPGAL